MRILSRCAGALALALALIGAAPALPALPNTPAGQRFGAWLQAFNSESVPAFRAYLQKYNPKAVGQAAQQISFARTTGGFVVRKIESSSPYKISVLVQEKLSDGFATITFALSPKPPHQLISGDISQAEPPPKFAPRHLPQAQLIAALQQRIHKYTSLDQFSGAVLVAKDGKPVFEQAYGMADRTRQIPNSLDTKFRIGSMNKMFTATAIMQLVQAGKIDLDAPFGTYITDYPNKSMSSQVTIRQLLTHTGGTGDIFGPQFEKNRLKLKTLQDYIDLYGKRPVLFKPGSKFDYSNYGFVLLGRVVEKVTGQTYYDYVHDHIFVPAGMTSTGSPPENVAVSNQSIGYMMSPDGKWVVNTNTLPYRATSAGGGYSTVGDLLRFANALQSHRLLDARYTTMMTTGKVAMGGPLKYGFGFGSGPINGTLCFGHNGGAPGMNGDLEICADGYTVVTLANEDPPSAERVEDFIISRLPK